MRVPPPTVFLQRRVLGSNSIAAAPAADLSDDTALEECYRHCRDIARVHSKTFYLSSLFLTPEKRRAVWAVYAFCRTADDFVDQITPPADRLASVDAWEAQLLAAYNGSATDPIFAALSDAARKFDIPIQPALDLLRGARMDITIRRYESYTALREYCYLVASTVGLLVMPILGTLSDDALEYGVALGRAMQMTNILRDVGEDARMGRIYLPSEDLHRFGCTESNVFEAVIDEPFIEMMRFQIDRVRTMYAEAEPGIAMLSPESRYTVRLALTLYRRILNAIEANRFDVFTRRAYVPFRTKMLSAMLNAFNR